MRFGWMAVIVLGLFGAGITACGEGGSAAECFDGVDNDHNGRTDCDDPGCATYCGDDDDAGDDDDVADCPDPADCDGDGYSTSTGDCDDHDGSIHPGAFEACDGVDQDCDGAIDEDFDADGDGYPSADNAECTANLPADQLDCDDTDGIVNPGQEEICGDAKDNDCDGAVDEDEDADADGYTTCDGDCDDSDETVHPNAPEQCNGEDDNCNGTVDEGLPVADYWPDADGDGFGDRFATAVTACEELADHVDNGDDCDDTNADIHPGATEVCNAMDDDCNGSADDGLDFDSYWPDADGDSFGDPDSPSVYECEQPPDHERNDDDCDDSDPSIHPDALEVTGDGIDQDCDGIDSPFWDQLSGGYTHTCGITAAGGVLCFGSDAQGQSSPPSGTFTHIDSGIQHVCGIRVGGSVECWGHNLDGQCNAPAGNFVALAGGYGHHCGILTSGDVECWGSEYYYGAPAGLFSQIDYGYHHACGVYTSGGLRCWGHDLYDVLDEPAGTYVQAAAGYYHACAIAQGGSVSCWGNDADGQASPPAGSFRQIDARGEFTCGVRSNNNVECWGNNDEGQTNAPVGSFESVTCGTEHACALRSDGTAACWGKDSSGQASPP